MITLKPSTATPGAYTVGGISKRELFAAMAMQGLAANPNLLPDLVMEEFSLRLADALITELAKERT